MIANYNSSNKNSIKYINATTYAITKLLIFFLYVLTLVNMFVCKEREINKYL